VGEYTHTAFDFKYQIRKRIVQSYAKLEKNPPSLYGYSIVER